MKPGGLNRSAAEFGRDEIQRVRELDGRQLFRKKTLAFHSRLSDEEVSGLIDTGDSRVSSHDASQLPCSASCRASSLITANPLVLLKFFLPHHVSLLSYIITWTDL